jgi:hypothetical protein
LGQGEVTIRAQAHRTRFHVAPDVAGLAELGSIGFDKGHTNQICDVLDQVGLADSGRADQDDVLLGVFHPVCLLQRERSGILGVMVVIADGYTERFLGLVLLDDEPIQMTFNVARSQLELENGMRFLIVGRLFRALGRAGLRRGCKARAKEPRRRCCSCSGVGRFGSLIK